MYERVVLTGFMGAGKSTVGRHLAECLCWTFFDVDAVLVERQGASVAELFARHGEPRFRALEADLVAALLQSTQAVLALGGGAVEHPATQALLRPTLPTPDGVPRGTLVVYLETSLELSLLRCQAEPGAAVRPILQDHAALAQRFERRLPLYQAAHLTLPTQGQSPLQLARLIADHLHRRMPVTHS